MLRVLTGTVSFEGLDEFELYDRFVLPEKNATQDHALDNGLDASGSIKNSTGMIETNTSKDLMEFILDVIRRQSVREFKDLPVDSRLTKYLDIDSQLIACFSVDAHVDEGVSLYPERILIILEAPECPGYVFYGEGRQGRFEIPIEPGQIIAFNEESEHGLKSRSPELIKKTSRLFWLIPPTRKPPLRNSVTSVIRVEKERNK